MEEMRISVKIMSIWLFFTQLFVQQTSQMALFTEQNMVLARDSSGIKMSAEWRLI